MNNTLRYSHISFMFSFLSCVPHFTQSTPGLQHTTKQRYKYVIISSSHLPRSRALWYRSSWSNSCCRGNSTARKFLSSSVKQYITWHCGNNKIVWYSPVTVAIKFSETVKSKERQAGRRSLFPMLSRRPQDVRDYALAWETAPAMTGLRNKIAIFLSHLYINRRGKEKLPERLQN